MDAITLTAGVCLFFLLLLFVKRSPVQLAGTGWFMSDNALKTPFIKTMRDFVDSRTGSALSLLPKQLPCHVVKIVSSEIVTVAFDVSTDYTLPQMTVPVATSEYVRLPIQVGDKGFCKGADVYLGGVTGLGGGTATMTRTGNLASLCFQPLGNTKWSEVDNNALTLYGPNGVVIEDTKKQAVITLTPTGLTIDLTKANGDVTINLASGHKVQINGDLVVSGNITAGKELKAGTFQHTHGGVSSGTAITQQPNSGTY